MVGWLELDKVMGEGSPLIAPQQLCKRERPEDTSDTYVLCLLPQGACVTWDSASKKAQTRFSPPPELGPEL
jgi:hypothetical protein